MCTHKALSLLLPNPSNPYEVETHGSDYAVVLKLYKHVKLVVNTKASDYLVQTRVSRCQTCDGDYA